MDECEVGTLRSLGEGGYASEGFGRRSMWRGATAVRPWGSTHGLLSLGTLGIWNVVGTPIEGLMSSEEFIVFRVFYDTQEKAKKVEVQG